MTREEFEELELQLQQSGMSLKSYLRQIGTSYSTYHYWRKKYSAKDCSCELAPIRFRQLHMDSDPVRMNGSVPSGATLLFPNGLRAHFGSGTEKILADVLSKSLAGHVLP